jgi:hypothetical protein
MTTANCFESSTVTIVTELRPMTGFLLAPRLSARPPTCCERLPSVHRLSKPSRIPMKGCTEPRRRHFFNIAREELGQASRFGELLKQNKERLPEMTGHLSSLPEGLELELPRR